MFSHSIFKNTPWCETRSEEENLRFNVDDDDAVFFHVLHGKWPEICLHCFAYLQFTSNSSVVTTSKMGWLKANFSHHHDHSQFFSTAHSHCDFDCDNEVIIWNIVLCVHRERDRMVNLKWKWASPLCSLFMQNEKSCENIHFPLNFPSEECSACFFVCALPASLFSPIHKTHHSSPLNFIHSARALSFSQAMMMFSLTQLLRVRKKRERRVWMRMIKGKRWR